MEESNKYLGEIGLLLLLIVLAIICVPVLCAICFATVIGATGTLFYGIVILISCLIWLGLWLVYYL